MTNPVRKGWVLRCNCGEPFAVWTLMQKGQFLHSKNKGGCGNRPRADFRGGGSKAVISGPYEYRHEATHEVMILRYQEADQDGMIKLRKEQINQRSEEAGLPMLELGWSIEQEIHSPISQRDITQLKLMKAKKELKDSRKKIKMLEKVVKHPRINGPTKVVNEIMTPKPIEHRQVTITEYTCPHCNGVLIGNIPIAQGADE